LVISIIIFIQQRMLAKNDNFKKKYSIQSVKDSIKLLKRNMQRNLSEETNQDEEKEKMILSVFIVRFL